MRVLQVFLLIVGILFLTAGVWVQDVRTTSCAVQELIKLGHLRTPPQPYDMSWIISFLHTSFETGLILKLIGFGILFSLFFFKIHQVSAKPKISAGSLAVFGFASSVCIIIFAISAPATRYIEWAFMSLASPFPWDLDTKTQQALRNAIAANGYSVSTGWLFLAGALFLLATALFLRRHNTIGAVSIPLTVPVVLLYAQRGVISRPEPTIVDVALRGWTLTFVVCAWLLATLAIFVIAFLARKTKPRVTSLLTMALTVATGCAVLAFWVMSLANAGRLASMAASPGRASIGNVLDAISFAWAASMILLFSSVFLPILCVFSLRQTPMERAKALELKKTSLPLVILIMSIGIFVLAAFFGLRENPYKASLRKVSVATVSYPKAEAVQRVEEDEARLESKEGLKFLREMVNDPREFHWHNLIISYLWEHARNPKAKEMALEILSDDYHPVGASTAYMVLWRDLRAVALNCQREDARAAALAALSRRPECGGRILQIALEDIWTQSGYAYDILRTCAAGGVNKFVFHKRMPHLVSEDALDLPEAFTVYYNRSAEVGTEKFPVKLIWCKLDSFEPSADPLGGRPVLEACGIRYPTIRNRYGELQCDYQAFGEDLENARSACESSLPPKQLCLELKADPLVPSRHIRYVLNACAKAGITEVSITEP